MYSTILQPTIITSPLELNIALTNVDARLKQRCINVVPTLCNVVSTLFQRRALTLYQRCATLKIRRRILFHFQRRINVISTLIHNVETIAASKIFHKKDFSSDSFWLKTGYFKNMIL